MNEPAILEFLRREGDSLQHFYKSSSAVSKHLKDYASLLHVHACRVAVRDNGRTRIVCRPVSKKKKMSSSMEKEMEILEDDRAMASFIDVTKSSKTEMTRRRTENDVMEIVGFACLIKVNESTFELKRVVVSERFRRRGIGREMVRSLIEEEVDLKTQRVVLETLDKMRAAVQLYESLGFKISRTFTCKDGTIVRSYTIGNATSKSKEIPRLRRLNTSLFSPRTRSYD